MEIAQSYDSMPYPSKFFVKTHPDNLATLATLFGMNPEPAEKCRVLELGCGNGSNLISHAYNLKDSTFVGVDISGKHIEQAKTWADELNLKNIEFHKIDLMEMKPEDFGTFDYIIGHGLISWIPDFVREKVFVIFGEMLTENGVGYLSYNAYPGSHYRNMSRQMMRFHTKNTEEPMEKVQESITFLSLLAEYSSEKEIYKPILEFELKRHFERDASDIYHDDLSECYQPLYFHEFAAKLKENNLQFLCESELYAMSAKNFPPDIQEVINQKPDIIEREQYIDFFLGRIFRQTLFCRQDKKLNHKLEPALLDKFLIASSVKPASESFELTIQKPEKFVGSDGMGIEIDHPPTKTALKYLGEIWGKAIPLTDLLQFVRQQLENTEYSPEDWKKELDITRAIILHIIQATDLIKLHLYQPNVKQEVSNTPAINDLAKWQIHINSRSVTTLLGINIDIDDEVSRHLLVLLDGTRDRNLLLKNLEEFIKSNDQIEDKQELLNGIENWLDKSLRELGKLGLFVS